MATRPTFNFSSQELAADLNRVFDPAVLAPNADAVVILVPDIGEFARVVTRVPLTAQQVLSKANQSQQLLSAQAAGAPQGSVAVQPLAIPVPPPAPIPVNPLIPESQMIPVNPQAELLSLGDIGRIGIGILGGAATGGLGGAILGGLGAAGVTGPGQTPTQGLPSVPTTGPTISSGGGQVFGPDKRPVMQSPVVVNPPFAGPPGVGVTFQSPFGVGGGLPQTEEELLAQLAQRGLDAADVAMTRLGGCPSGMRLNKSSYFRRDSQGNVIFVPKGTRCVKSRRLNPANGRATRRAISRVKSAKRLAKDLGRITIRDKKNC